MRPTSTQDTPTWVQHGPNIWQARPNMAGARLSGVSLINHTELKPSDSPPSPTNFQILHPLVSPPPPHPLFSFHSQITTSARCLPAGFRKRTSSRVQTQAKWSKNLLIKYYCVYYATAPQQLNACWSDFPGKFPQTKRKVLDRAGELRIEYKMIRRISAIAESPRPWGLEALGLEALAAARLCWQSDGVLLRGAEPLHREI